MLIGNNEHISIQINYLIHMHWIGVECNVFQPSHISISLPHSLSAIH